MTTLKKYIFLSAFLCLIPFFTNASVFNQQNAQNLNGGIIDGTLRLGDALLADTTGNDVTVKGITSINSLLSYVKSYFNDKIFIGYPASLSPVDYGAELQLHGSAKLLALADTSATGSRLLCVNNDGVIEACEDSSDEFICGSPLFDDRNGAIYQTIEVDGKCWFKNNLAFSHVTQTDLYPVFEINNEILSGTFNASNISAIAFTRLREFCSSKDADFDTPGLSVYIERNYPTDGISVLKVNCAYSSTDYFMLEQNHNVYPISSSYTGSMCPSGWSYPSKQDFIALGQSGSAYDAGFNTVANYYGSGNEILLGSYYLTNDPDDLVSVTSDFVPGTGPVVTLIPTYSYHADDNNVSAASVRCIKNA